jgi:hypothetical protein
LAARIPGNQAGQRSDGHPAQGQEEVDVEVIHEEVMDYPFNLFEFKF